MKIKVLLADDNQLFRELLAARFAQTSEIEVVAETADCSDILEIIKQTKPDVVLLEIDINHLKGALTTMNIWKNFPTVKVIALTSHLEKSFIKDMLEAKVWGYILKNCTFDQLLGSIIQVYAGKKQLSTEIQSIIIEEYLDKNNGNSTLLTKREKEILRLLAEGKSIREISKTLFISIKTAGTHKQNIFNKMHFEHMAQLIKYAIKKGIVS